MLPTQKAIVVRSANDVLDELKAKIVSKFSSKWSAQGEGNAIDGEKGAATGSRTSAQGEEGAATDCLNQFETCPTELYIDPPMSQCKGRKRKPQRLKLLLEILLRGREDNSKMMTSMASTLCRRIGGVSTIGRDGILSYRISMNGIFSTIVNDGIVMKALYLR